MTLRGGRGAGSRAFIILDSVFFFCFVFFSPGIGRSTSGGRLEQQHARPAWRAVKPGAVRMPLRVRFMHAFSFLPVPRCRPVASAVLRRRRRRWGRERRGRRRWLLLSTWRPRPCRRHRPPCHRVSFWAECAVIFNGGRDRGQARSALGALSPSTH